MSDTLSPLETLQNIVASTFAIAPGIAEQARAALPKAEAQEAFLAGVEIPEGVTLREVLGALFHVTVDLESYLEGEEESQRPEFKDVHRANALLSHLKVQDNG